MTKRSRHTFTMEKLCWLAILESQPELSIRTLANLAKVQLNQIHGSEDNLILAHLQDKADVEVLEDVQDEVEDGALPNLFDEDPADAPEPAATAEKQAVAELAREADQSDAADKEGAKAASFSNEEDVADQVMGGAVD
ncbi:unnamed protein product [Closterium sp. NIES-53]